MAVLEASLLALWKPDVEGLYLTDKDTKSAKIGRRARENAQIHNKKYGHLESSTAKKSETVTHNHVWFSWR